MFLASLILLLPLFSAAAILLGAQRRPALSSYISVGSATIAFVCALLMLGTEEQIVTLFDWIRVGDAFVVDIGFQIDALSKGMMFIVTFVGALVHWYSLGYMRDDEGMARYFAGLSLFMFSMSGIVLANNFVMMFIFWELVGLSSYLLIGHWFRKSAAADAAKKAFLVNRIGDFGFMAGILLLWAVTGAIHFASLEAVVPGLAESAPGFATAAALLIFCGAVGKSAQFPLHVWLPDAMEGPTPVSALIHAATMVAAGVYMLVRVIFLVEASESAAHVIAWIGAITALMAALMATQQNDIKRILAYSTLSQLGYMVMAVGLLAAEAAMFHLFTHAFFKALLFLGAGAVIIACHHQQDIWRMGGLRRRMPLTFWTFAIGTAALVAVPGTAGFFSKEAILAAAFNEQPVLFWIAAGTAFLTAFYMTRLFVVAFLGEARTDEAAGAREVGLTMSLPLIILAVPSIIAGYGIFADEVSALRPAAHAGEEEGHLGIVLIVSLASLVLGIVAAFVMYPGRRRDPVNVPPLAHRFYLDELYLAIVRLFQDGLAVVCRLLDDYLIGGLFVKGSSLATGGIGNLLRRVQVGNLQTYAILLGMGIVLVIYFTVFRF